MSGRESWNMSRIVSQRPLPKVRTMLAGETQSPIHAENLLALNAETSRGRNFPAADCCSGCGYHVCTCKRAEQNNRVDDTGRFGNVNWARAQIQAGRSVKCVQAKDPAGVGEGFVFYRDSWWRTGTIKSRYSFGQRPAPYGWDNCTFTLVSDDEVRAMFE